MTDQERARNILNVLISWRDEFRATTDADMNTIVQNIAAVRSEDGMCEACASECCECECHLLDEYVGVSDDEWCADCGESLPCMCDDYYDDERADDQECD